MDELQKNTDPYASLKIPAFRNFQLARFLLTFSVQMMETILAWQIYKLTNDKLSLGLIGLWEAIPFVSTSLFSGHLVDTFNRYKIARLAVISILICFLGIGVLMCFLPNFIVQNGVLPIYFLIGLSGIARGFMAPSFQSIFPQLIPKNLLGNAATWASNAWQTAAVLGPALGGLVFEYTNLETVFALALSFMGCSIALFFRVPVLETPPKKANETLSESLTAGLRFVFSKQEMLGAISLDLFAVLFGGAVALLPVFAKDILVIGAHGLGFLRAAPFLGSVAMGFFLAHKPPLANAGKNLLISVAFFGLATIGFALSTNFYLSFFMLFLTGAFDNVSVIIRQTIVQTMTPDNMRGRVSAVNQIFIASSNEIGGFESALAASWMGTVPSVIFGGCMTLLVVSTTALSLKKIRNLKL